MLRFLWTTVASEGKLLRRGNWMDSICVLSKLMWWSYANLLL